MKYVGLLAQQRRNNLKSVFLLVLFPVIFLAVTYVAVFLISALTVGEEEVFTPADATWNFLQIAPIVVVVIGIWFVIAYFANTSIINHSTGARPLERRENPRIYNLVENLCIAGGMKMPKVNIIDDPQLNAFASGINDKTYAVTLTTGIIDKLNDEELSGVIAHELTHIRNRDTRLLVISIVFVGIMSVLMQYSFRIGYEVMRSNSRSRSNSNSKGNGAVIAVTLLVVALCTALGYLFTSLTRFAISRKREFMADAGGAELCHNPMALASALRKISDNPAMEDTNREDIAQLFIFHGKKKKDSFFQRASANLFATHPDIKERIRLLEQF